MRGEYLSRLRGRTPHWELPPRARRIRVVAVVYPGVFGTTSACAENTPNHATNHGGDRNYLRVRGEYGQSSCAIIAPTELPPRARRIPLARTNQLKSPGTTSACAENTRRSLRAIHRPGNYLRVRGEYFHQGQGRHILGELPPRARRIRLMRVIFFQQLGTTSACAENTPPSSSPVLNDRNYLRVRGEYPRARPPICTPLELPPRARRIRFAGCPC